MKTDLLIILGPTASGKTLLAVNLAAKLNGEVISADSRQIFKGMDLGTGKDLDAYDIDGLKIPHHLINIHPAGAKYNVDVFKTDFYAAFENIAARGKLPILCGGTGMYIHSILQDQPYTAIPVNEQLREELIGIEKAELLKRLAIYPQAHTAHADISSVKRIIRAIEIAMYLEKNPVPGRQIPEINYCVMGLETERQVLRGRIHERLVSRLEAGLVEEVRTLLKEGVSSEMLVWYGLEYKFVAQFLGGTLEYNTMVERLSTAICQYAKRQSTFFRKMEKDGVKINWIDAENEFDVLLKNVISIWNKGYN